MPYNPTSVEKKWQRYWLENKTFRALDPAEAGDRPKKYILDMFPYPSGEGLHVGHPEGYTATDIVSRYWRHKGHNVLHTMGWDAFGLPAEQYAVKNNTHPRVTTERNIVNFRKQIQSLGLSYDWDREVDTTDPAYFKWTQWIFLQLYKCYFDPFDSRAKPIAHLINELENENILIAPDGSIHINPVQEGLEAVAGESSTLRKWSSYNPSEQRDIIDGVRLAYTDEAPVNWCPELGTVLSNEEVIDGKSEVGGFPVERRPMRQWLLRITAYSDRLLEDLKTLDWSDSLKEMQRNWIGRSIGAEVDFEVDGRDDVITVFTTRPDTLFGATYMVLAPEHRLVDFIVTPDQKAEVEKYRSIAKGRSERDRMQGAKEKTGVFTGAYAINPVNDAKIPIWIADYVLMGYGTGAIMAVPAHDDRDFEFAEKFGLSIKQVVQPAKNPEAVDTVHKAFPGEGIAINSSFLDGLPTAEAKERMSEFLEEEGVGKKSINYKLRDWLFSRQRYWGEPFPIVLDSAGNHFAIDESELPLTLPEMADFKPTGTPEAPLSKAKDWIRYSDTLSRETNTMPQWAGSCWYYLRYIDPRNPESMVDAEKERYWMPVDLYVGGVEHAVLHLLYARFWHKVLFDLGHVSTAEPFQRLVNQGMILGETEFHFFEVPGGKALSLSEFTDVKEEATDKGLKMVGTHKTTGQRHIATPLIEQLVEKKGDKYVLRVNNDIVVDARSFKMSKSRGNVVNPDRIVEDYGADALRMYEMYMGPLEAQKPWNTRDITGPWRLLSSLHRNLLGDEENGKTVEIVTGPVPADLDRQLHAAIKKIGEDIEALRFNTAIAEIFKLNNAITNMPQIPRAFAETLTLLLSPFAPHLAEELWEKLGHAPSIQTAAWPKYDPAKLVETQIELPVQINGKLRDKLVVAIEADEEMIFQLVEGSEKIKPWLEGKTIKKRVYVAKKMVNYVVG